MARRYSGDVEVRLGWDPRTRTYKGSVRDPEHRWRGSVGPRYAYRFIGRDPDSSKGYDDAAKRLIEAAEADQGRMAAERRGRTIQIRRVFQAPCPTSARCPKGGCHTKAMRLTRGG